MRTIIKLLAVMAAFSPAVVLADDTTHRFTDRGISYVYTVKADAHGRQVITGRSQPGNSDFRLVVDGDRVEGVSGGQPVAFRTPRTVAPVTVASR